MELFYPKLLKDEWLEELGKVFSTRWLGQGPKVEEFERAFGDKFGYTYPLAVNSGSSALELAYHLIGISEGDEVLTTVFTCTATNISLLRRKAKIVFTDINDNLLMDYGDLKKKASPATKAIVVVNLGGLRVDQRIFDFAKELQVPVVVDAAQSVGITEPEGDYVCYSFQAIKHFTTGDGGMLVLRDEETYKRAKKLRWFGIDREAKKRVNWRCVVNHQTAMEIEEAGYKFHMNDIAATMGLVGLRHSDEILEYRRQIVARYEGDLRGFQCVSGGACWLFAVLTAKRDGLMEHLRNKGIECDPVQLRNDIFKVFGGKRQDLPNMNDLENQYLYLPLHNEMTISDVDRITEAIWQYR